MIEHSVIRFVLEFTLVLDTGVGPSRLVRGVLTSTVSYHTFVRAQHIHPTEPLPGCSFYLMSFSCSQKRREEKGRTSFICRDTAVEKDKNL